MIKQIAVFFVATIFLTNVYAGVADAAESKSCPWRITGIEAGKWANGNQKAAIWAHGSFPINIPGTTERPTWIVNGVNVGLSTTFFNLKRLPNTSRLLRKGRNTVTVKFLKAPYAGASNSYSFNFDWAQIRPGQHKKF